MHPCRRSQYDGEYQKALPRHVIWSPFVYQHQEGPSSTIAQSTVRSIYPQKYKSIAVVANIGLDTNWRGHHFAQANWHAFW